MVKVIGIKYEIRPPRLCGLRLAVLKENGDHTSFSFDLKYHDMQDVIDFLVLRQTYEAGLARKWKEGLLIYFKCLNCIVQVINYFNLLKVNDSEV